MKKAGWWPDAGLLLPSYLLNGFNCGTPWGFTSALASAPKKLHQLRQLLPALVVVSAVNEVSVSDSLGVFMPSTVENKLKCRHLGAV